MTSHISRFKRIFLDILFPSICVFCKQHIDSSGLAACTKCLDSLEIFNTFFCCTCKARLPNSKKICHKSSPVVLGAATTYTNESARLLVQGLKYRGTKPAAKIIAEILARYLHSINLDLRSSVLVPIPLHKKREGQRGFNQSDLIAQYLSEKISRPICHALKRTVHTPPQTEMKGLKNRKENVLGVFETTNTLCLRKMRVILIDDVVTSGATLEEAAKALKKSGSRNIVGLVLAKAR